MNLKTIAAIALSNRDFESLDQKLHEAVKWIELAAGSGADLAVLPEFLNSWRGDGVGNARAIPLQEMAMDDWQRDCRVLIEAAARCGLAVTIPVLRREASQGLINCFFLISKQGQVLGEYQKQYPTPGELDAGVRPGKSQLIKWEGLKVGGAICFDTQYPEVFQEQADEGADLFLVPSLWPGGDQLNTCALQHSTPIALSYPAWSRIIDIDGREIAAAGYRWETLRFGFGSPIAMGRINFNKVALFGDGNQEKILDVQRVLGKQVAVRFDQQNVLFILESRCPELRISQVIERFGLMPRRTYLRECRKQVQNRNRTIYKN
jgi:predicted amidohydrolase